MSARSFASGDAMAESEPDPVRPVEPLPVVAPDEVAQAIDTADKATSIRFIRNCSFLPGSRAGKCALYRLAKSGDTAAPGDMQWSSERPLRYVPGRSVGRHLGSPASELPLARREPFQRLEVAGDPLPHNPVRAHLRDDAHLPPRLALRQVRDVHFHYPQPRRGYRVTQRIARVRVRARVEDHSVRPAAKLVQLVDQCPFVIALVRAHGTAELPRALREDLLHLRERRGPVHFGLPLAEEVQVGPVEEQHVHDKLASTARTHSSADTSSTLGPPSPARSTKRPLPARAFLSCASAASAASLSSPDSRRSAPIFTRATTSRARCSDGTSRSLRACERRRAPRRPSATASP